MMKMHMNRIKSFRMDLRIFTVKFRASDRFAGEGVEEVCEEATKDPFWIDKPR